LRVAERRRQSHPVAGTSRRPIEQKVESKTDWKACMYWADAARFGSVLAIQSNRGTDRRAIASGTVANPCNPAAPEVPLWQPCRLLARRKPAGRQMLLDNSAAAVRMPSGSHWKTATKQSSWQAPELWRSRSKLALPVRFDRPRIDRIRSPLTTMPASP
jgi:hypothetical protein